MVDKLEDVWASRDFPVLVEVVRRVDRGDVMPGLSDVGTALEMPADQVKLATAALKRRGLVDTLDSAAGPMRFKNVSGEAYLLTGLHPSADDTVDRFVEALKQAADQVDDEDDASALRKIARTVGSVSTDVIGAVLGAVATRAAGM